MVSSRGYATNKSVHLLASLVGPCCACTALFAVAGCWTIREIKEGGDSTAEDSGTPTDSSDGDVDSGGSGKDTGSGADTGVIDTTTDAGTLVTVYDFTSDFDDIANPNGVWTYGWAAALGAPVVVFPDASMSGADGSPAWRDFDNIMLGAPVAWRNLSGGEVDGVPPGMASLHPGLTNEYTVARFTAPDSGTYSAIVRIYSGDIGETDAAVVVQSFENALGETSLTPTFDLPATLLGAGDTIDVWIGPTADGGFSDNTPLTFVVFRLD